MAGVVKSVRKRSASGLNPEGNTLLIWVVSPRAKWTGVREGLIPKGKPLTGPKEAADGKSQHILTA